MNRTKSIYILCCCVLLFFTGCATKVAFHYPEFNKENSAAPATDKTIAVTFVNDKRAEQIPPDTIYDKNLIEEVNRIIAEELKSVNLFKDVILIPA